MASGQPPHQCQFRSLETWPSVPKASVPPSTAAAPSAGNSHMGCSDEEGDKMFAMATSSNASGGKRRAKSAAGLPAEHKHRCTESIKGKTLAKPESRKQVAQFPQEVPIDNKTPGMQYFVRDCYPEYYRLVMELLSKYDGVSVMGTPGIGKSVFMGYYYQEYHKAHPNATIIMSSYSQGRHLKSVMVKAGAAEPQKVVIDKHEMLRTLRLATEAADKRQDTDAIWLLDGPPKTIPPSARWVSFTSPNELWGRELLKNVSTVAKVYMPVWSDIELATAAKALKRTDRLVENDDKHQQELHFLEKKETAMSVLDARFAVFGGIPWVCFEADSLAVIEHIRELKMAVGSMNWTALVEAIESSPSGELAQRLLHYMPLENKRQYRIQVAFGEIERHMVHREPELFQGSQ